MSGTAPKIYNILFLCTRNSARSILAEAITNRLGRGRFGGYSAGSHPGGRVHPDAIELLIDLGHETAHLHSKGFDAFTGPGAPKMDFVITVCDDAAGEACPVWPGHPVTAHWGIPDPIVPKSSSATVRSALAKTYERLERRISALLDLPVNQLDDADLKRRLQEIGEMEGATALVGR
jgi:protein-tyrosine-phosphatase